MTELDPQDFKTGMRRLAAAVNIIAAAHDGAPAGLLATAVCSVCAEPPTLLVCVNRSARSYAAIRDSGAFCVNLLAQDQAGLARSFLDLEGAERFSACRWTTLKTAAPAIEGALANFDCEITETVQAGTHTVFLGRVVAMRTSAARAPLLYFDGAYAGLAEDGDTAA
jgi:flavin reductase (DIM6/NTAB) family NADH-FMN oxidoreductase RutF